MSFHAKELLWLGFYELSLEIFDRQGKACKDKQKLQVEVCTCEEDGTCDIILAHQHDSSSKVGFPALGALIGALILLMCELNQRQFSYLSSVLQYAQISGFCSILITFFLGGGGHFQ